MNIWTLLHWLAFSIAVASIALIALTWLEGAIAIWFPRVEGSRFWNCFDKLKLTLKYISASEEKLSAARFAVTNLKEGKTQNDTEQ